jgi:transcriptional regulator with XRE-family HTH domain
MEHLKQQVGLAVRTARKRRKLTQEMLAGDAGVSMETISNVERGVTLPTLDVLFKIARVLPLDLAALSQNGWGENDRLSKERLRFEAALQEIVMDVPDDKFPTLIEIARVFARK